VRRFERVDSCVLRVKSATFLLLRVESRGRSWYSSFTHSRSSGRERCFGRWLDDALPDPRERSLIFRSINSVRIHRVPSRGRCRGCILRHVSGSAHLAFRCPPSFTPSPSSAIHPFTRPSADLLSMSPDCPRPPQTDEISQARPLH